MKFDKGNMMNILKSLLILAVAFAIIGCGDNNNDGSGGNGKGDGNGDSTELPADITAAFSSPLLPLSQELKNTLSYMGNEERLAYDVYNYLYAKWGIKQFNNIATKSEYKHIQSVQGLVQKYSLLDDNNKSFTNIDLPSLGYKDTPIDSMEAGKYDISAIQNLYDTLIVEGVKSEIDALKVACTIEVVDVDDLDDYIAIAEAENATDVLAVFNYLRNGSYNHYWAFDEGLKTRGVSDGCCSSAKALGHATCPTYPQK